MFRLVLGAHLFHGLFRMLRLARFGPAVALTPAEARGNAYALSYAIFAALWLRNSDASSWGKVYESWNRDSRVAEEPEARLYGSFHLEDRFDLLTDNHASFVERARLLESATRSVDIATYYVQADATGWHTARQLAECASKGIRVRVIADRAVTESKTFENPAMREIEQFLKRSGVEFKLYRNPKRPFDANHRKLMLIDGTTIVTGGRNYADHYSGGDWRDIDIVLSGPSVRDAISMFEGTFTAGAPSKEKQISSSQSIFHPTTPENILHNPCFEFLLQCTRSAKRTLDIENAYYTNHPLLHESLTAAIKRGVRVRIFTNSAESNDLVFKTYRMYCGFAELLKTGIEIYLRRGKGRTLHCKYFIADGEWIGFGSSNLDCYSPRFCMELGIQVRSAELGGRLTDWFEQGIVESERLTDPAVAERIISSDTVGKIFDRYLKDF